VAIFHFSVLFILWQKKVVRYILSMKIAEQFSIGFAVAL